MKKRRTSDNLRSRTAGTRLSLEQYDVLLKQLAAGERPTDYVRRLIAEDMQRRGVTWPDYDFIANDERAPDKKGMPWITKRTPKNRRLGT